MPTILLTAPAVEPLTLAEAKSFLRVAHGDDDALITALIAAARAHVETATRRALLAQTWRLVRDAWPADGRVVVTPAPLIAVVAGAVPANLRFAPWSLPVPGVAANGIEIDVDVGHGAAVATVPAALIQAVRLLVAHWYEHRGIVVNGQAGAPLPHTIRALLAPYRVVSL